MGETAPPPPCSYATVAEFWAAEHWVKCFWLSVHLAVCLSQWLLPADFDSKFRLPGHIYIIYTPNEYKTDIYFNHPSLMAVFTFYLLVSAKSISNFIIHPPFTSQLQSLPDWTLLQKWYWTTSSTYLFLVCILRKCCQLKGTPWILAFSVICLGT